MASLKTGAVHPGLSASPLVANLACRALDHRLMALASEFEGAYSRYADDISFSGEQLPPVSRVAHAVEAEGFLLSAKKVRMTKRGQAHFVTGLSVNDAKRPHVPREMKRRLRQELYYCEKHSVEGHLIRIGHSPRSGINRLDGSVRYVSFVERGTGYDFSARWAKLLARDDLTPTAGPDYARIHKTYFAAVDETKIKLGERVFLAVGFAYYDEADEIDRAVREVVDEYLTDPFAGGKKKDIEKHGLHFSHANRSLQLAFILRLPTVPMRCLVAITEINEESGGQEDAYLRAFQWGLRQVSERSDRGRLKLFVEQSDVKASAIRELVKAEYGVMEVVGKKRPMSLPDVDIVGKDVAAVSVPDSMLGILRLYVELSNDPGANQQMTSDRQHDFERVRDRFSLIYFIDKRSYFSHKKPFAWSSLTREG